MLFQLDENIKNSYEFRFQNPTELSLISTIHAIGIEPRIQEPGGFYYWDCQLHPDNETFIFQYTLEGVGEIRIKDKTYALPQGYVFMVSVPEDCEYYLPPSSTDWKFIFITLKGSVAKKCWEYINSHHGYVFEIPIEKRIIQRLLKTYIDVKEHRISNAYRASGEAYEFIAYCYQHFDEDHYLNKFKFSNEVTKAIDYIKNHYHLAIEVLDIAEHVGLSKSHFNKKFKQETGHPPLNYLNKYRIEKSAYLLQHTKKTVGEISAESGFADPNYFCKAFRKATGTSPNLFRKGRDESHLSDFLITDQYGVIDLG